MFRITVITLLLSYGVTLFSQSIYSRDFEARKKNVPLSIINNNSNFFYLLRYNKAAHDITIERRAKPSAEILSFTPLKLDSVNADWFDYEKLDYLFFEHKYKTYFVFEKVLNSKKTIYLKISDTLGKSSGFIELASIDKENGVTDISFEFSRTINNSILIIASQTYGDIAVKKRVILFDCDKRITVWTKKLPLENGSTGFSTAFECTDYNDLFYVLIKAHVASYKRKVIGQTQIMAPVLFYDSLTLVNFSTNNLIINKSKLAINNLTNLNSICLIPLNSEVSVIAHFSKLNNFEKVNVYFLNQKFNTDLSKVGYVNIVPLDSVLNNNLTFFDGSDFKNPSDKEYRLKANFQTKNIDCNFSERTEDYYHKEILIWKNNLENGNIFHQKIIPRKIYSFKGRTRFKNIGIAMPVIYEDKLAVLVLESPLNFKQNPNTFNYHRFKKETNLWKSNIVMYQINSDGSLEKKLVYHNTNYDAVPMQYQTKGQKDFVLYLNNGKSEKFFILNLDQL